MIGPDQTSSANTAGPSAPERSRSVDLIVASLRRLRGTARVQLVLQRLGLIVASLLAAALFIGFLDYWLRLPMAMRLILWAFGMSLAALTAYRRVLPAARFSPSLTEVALRVEQSPAGKAAGLEGMLASGIELGAGKTFDRGLLSDDLGRGAVSEAARRFGRLPRRTSLLDSRLLYRTLGALVAVGAPILALSLATPALSRIGWSRVAAPWSGAQWPKRTQVVGAVQPVAHAVGTPFPLRAVVARTGHREGTADVSAVYRLVIDGQAGPNRRALLTSQNKQATVEPPGGALPVTGELYERLLDTASLVPATGPRPANVVLEFAFHTADDATDVWRVLLVDPPALQSVTADVSPPEYAGGVLAADSEVVRGLRDLGTGRDERSILGPILGGSMVRLDFTLNKPVPVPESPEGLDEWAAHVLPGLDRVEDLAATFDGPRWSISFRATRSTRVPIRLVDSFGIPATEDAVLRFETIEDRSASVAVVEPSSDESVLPTAVLDVAGEGRDDIALAWVTLKSQSARPPAGSIGAPPEPSDDLTEIAKGAPDANTRAALTVVRAETRLDLSPLSLEPGDEMWLTAEAMDLLTAATPGRGPSVSSKRRLRIIAESEFVEQIRAELTGVREAAKRLEGEQERLAKRLAAAKADPAAAEAQAAGQSALGQRLSPIGDVLRRLTSRVERNQLRDESLTGMLRDAQEHVNAAGRASDQAAAQLGTLASEGLSPESRDQSHQQAASGQKEVQDELTSLANLLDRGQDVWAVRRQLEKLLTEQRQLRAQTEATGAETRGQRPESLSQAQAEDLQRLAGRQQEVARRADAIVDALLQRAQHMRQGDPSQADSMQAAANRAQQQQLGDSQRRAAEQIEKNQTAAAEELQKNAEQAIQDVLDELDRVEQRRDEALRRLLADLVESIAQLVRRQEQELLRLGEALAGNVPDKLDAGMISLNQNTLGVLDTAQEEVRGAVKLLSLLSAAAEAQGDGITSIRADEFPEAQTQENLSLSRLRDSLEEARRLEDQAAERDASRKRAELKKAYSEALEIQAAINADTTPLLGKELSRKERGEARALGDQQLALRETLSQLRSSTEDLNEALVFQYAHRRLDDSTARASSSLREGKTPASVGFDQQASLRTLQALVQALTDPPRNDDFREEEGGDGGGGGGGGGNKPPLIPPLAELKLLRAIQNEAAELTRQLDADRASIPPSQLEALVQLQGDLAARARELLEKLTENNNAPGDVGPPDEMPQPNPPPPPDEEQPGAANPGEDPP
ncbi:hypothetical protein PHYC_02552 [Phycisphaerales bacterium]|nr:hypothetical protein PHYC_02552 [Phycisphaerales bacterium]